MNLSREEKRVFRALLFKHQDGLAISNTISTLSSIGILDYFNQNKNTTLDELLVVFPKLNGAYLAIALRSLASQGIFDYKVGDKTISITSKTKLNLLKDFISLYTEYSLVYKTQLKLLQRDFKEDFEISNDVMRLSERWNELSNENLNNTYYQSEVLVHLEAILLLPILVYIHYSTNLIDSEVLNVLSEHNTLKQFFTNLKLYNDRELTKKGSFLFNKSYAYGVTTSYLPIMANVEDYLNGNFQQYFERDAQGNEQHVFRGINVWGSGGSHNTYFKKIDTVLLDIFNRPLEEQPKGIIDVGCGNGALLEHMFNLIWNQTNRRNDLDKNKLILIGADYNKEALLSTQRNLKKADVWAEVVWGDIGNPAEIDEKLGKLYGVRLGDLLNIRSFLDHNRPYNAPKTTNDASTTSTGAFAHRGTLLKNSDVEQSLLEHLLKWKPYIQRHGLLLIELHTIDPNIVSVNLGNTPCTAYDVTHGFSDQYIVEIGVFNKAIERAGLLIDKEHYYKFPNSELSTVSINLIS